MTVVFVGDSITDCGRRTDPEGLGTGYVRILAGLIDEPVVNAGMSGDRAVDLRRRWSTDVIAHAPDMLTVYVGINDTWRRYDSGDPTTAEDFERDYRAMLQSAVDLAAPRLILIEPFVAPVTHEQRFWHEDLDPKRSVVAALAAEFDAAFVPLQRLVTAAIQNRDAADVAADGVHPTPFGHRLIADAWLGVYRR